MRGKVTAQLWTASFWSLYTIAAAAVIIWSALLVMRGHESLLAEMLTRPWVALATYAPIIVGLIMQLIGRRFWAWPYVYLLVFALAIAGTGGDLGDQMFAYGGSIVWVVTVLVAESVGMTLGRWLHRFVGIAFFIGAGAWMLIQGLGTSRQDLVDRWQAQTLILAGGLYIIHAAIQLTNYRRQQLSAVAAGAAPPDSLPQPAAGAAQEPRDVNPDQPNWPQADKPQGEGDNTKSE